MQQWKEVQFTFLKDLKIFLIFLYTLLTHIRTGSQLKKYRWFFFFTVSTADFPFYYWLCHHAASALAVLLALFYLPLLLVCCFTNEFFHYYRIFFSSFQCQYFSLHNTNFCPHFISCWFCQTRNFSFYAIGFIYSLLFRRFVLKLCINLIDFVWCKLFWRFIFCKIL